MSTTLVAFDVGGPVRPELRVEVAGGRRMLLRQGARPLLLARTSRDHYGVDLLRAGDVRSPVAPCRAGRARALAGSEADARWAHVFAGELAAAADGPLHTGRWILTRHEAARRYEHLRPSERWLLLDGRINWFTTPGDWDVVPLRTPSAPGSARVRAYRKQARDGTLPPILLWWISGLACHVLLDGHDRLVAALAEDREPSALVLALRGDEREKAASRDWALREYARATAHVDGQVAAGTAHPFTGYVAVNRRLGETLSGIERIWGRTRAWPLPGGPGAWQRQADAVDPTWPAARTG
ncbi:hypothetical protein [Actinomadura sp. DC4]|uniref:hypothetical protein n=1 Tax=Actinomadura sp. DC4 TaxID=3055069 RepID=UPI0025B22199|nr:hypothetical protein [Actinomadura sp. DC4]MDN3352242.1 hypothetical protein [Actinomadura sp. DC4]